MAREGLVQRPYPDLLGLLKLLVEYASWISSVDITTCGEGNGGRGAGWFWYPWYSASEYWVPFLLPFSPSPSPAPGLSTPFPSRVSCSPNPSLFAPPSFAVCYLVICPYLICPSFLMRLLLSSAPPISFIYYFIVARPTSPCTSNHIDRNIGQY